LPRLSTRPTRSACCGTQALASQQASTSSTPTPSCRPMRASQSPFDMYSRRCPPNQTPFFQFTTQSFLSLSSIPKQNGLHSSLLYPQKGCTASVTLHIRANLIWTAILLHVTSRLQRQWQICLAVLAVVVPHPQGHLLTPPPFILFWVQVCPIACDGCRREKLGHKWGSAYRLSSPGKEQLPPVRRTPPEAQSSRTAGGSRSRALMTSSQTPACSSPIRAAGCMRSSGI
jgi:hypothetical protein